MSTYGQEPARSAYLEAKEIWDRLVASLGIMRDLIAMHLMESDYVGVLLRLLVMDLDASIIGLFNCCCTWETI